MKIYPQDLRPSLHEEIIRRRANAATPEQGQAVYLPPAKEPHIGFLGKFWAQGADMTPEQAAVGLPAASTQTMASVWAPLIFGALLSFLISVIIIKKGGASPEVTWAVAAAVAGLIAYLGAFPLGKATFRGLYNRPVTVSELEMTLSKTEMDAVEKSYFTLLRDAIRQDIPKEAERRMRDAITSLGAALDRLPPVIAVPQDTVALRADAARMMQEAGVQTDRVLAESLERRAEAVERRASLNERSALFARRQMALRAEVLDQIEAMREGVAAFQTGAADVDSLEALSESAHRLAAETAAATTARAELDAATTVTLPAQEAATIVIGIRR